MSGRTKTSRTFYVSNVTSAMIDEYRDMFTSKLSNKKMSAGEVLDIVFAEWYASRKPKVKRLFDHVINSDSEESK